MSHKDTESCNKAAVAPDISLHLVIIKFLILVYKVKSASFYLKPGEQAQLNSFNLSIHVPLLRHGML